VADHRGLGRLADEGDVCHEPDIPGRRGLGVVGRTGRSSAGAPGDEVGRGGVQRFRRRPCRRADPRAGRGHPAPGRVVDPREDGVGDHDPLDLERQLAVVLGPWDAIAGRGPPRGLGLGGAVLGAPAPHADGDQEDHEQEEQADTRPDQHGPTVERAVTLAGAGGGRRGGGDRRRRSEVEPRRGGDDPVGRDEAAVGEHERAGEPDPGGVAAHGEPQRRSGQAEVELEGGAARWWPCDDPGAVLALSTGTTPNWS
jgi:hypothetical protein